MTDQTFYLTFGSQYPRVPHPNWDGADTNGWVEVTALNERTAREVVIHRFGVAWSMLYDQDKWDRTDLQWFPLGCIGKILCVGPRDYHVGLRRPVDGRYARIE